MTGSLGGEIATAGGVLLELCLGSVSVITGDDCADLQFSV
jgi:hypothetical protein